jgi:hypothetical protein
MSEENAVQPDPTLEEIAPSRREFLRTMIAGAKYATPVLLSFTVSDLSAQTVPPECTNLDNAFHLGPEEQRRQLREAGCRVS